MSNQGPLQIRGHELSTGSGPFIFGILNVTPDSFSDGGIYAGTSDAVEAGCRMAEEGADAIDIGGESTRPGSRPVSPDEQIRRTQTVIAELSKRFGKDGPAISIDTRSAVVAKVGLEAGASIINDISALRDDPGMADMVARYKAGIILMHMKGTPADMQENPVYQDIFQEIKDFLADRIDYATEAGIDRERIIIDPGIGFGKTTSHNLDIIHRADVFNQLGVPVMIGPSRKRFISEILGIDQPANRLMGTAAAVAACILAGVECVRVHDVAACRQVADMCAAIRRGRSS